MKVQITLILILLSLLQQTITFKTSNNNDIYIGVYTQPAHFGDFTADKYQYILESNVQWIEGAGAKVVGIPFSATQDQLKEIFQNINGILFTGGSMDLDIDTPVEYTNENYNIFTKNAEFLVNLAIEANDNGDFFPVWGNCQGFQLMSYIQAKYKKDILQHVDGDENISRKGIFSNRSRMFENIDENLLIEVTKENFLFYYHEWAVFPKTFQKYSELNEFYRITGHSSNSNNIYSGTQYVASFEAFDYPFYGLQFHPEYAIYDTNKNTNNSKEARKFNGYFAEFFKSQFEQNQHDFNNKSELLQNCLISKYQKQHFPGGFFEYIYFVKNELYL